MCTSTVWAFLRCFFRNYNFSALITVISRNSVSPPDLSGNTPVFDVLKPVQINLVKTLRYKRSSPVFRALIAGFASSSIFTNHCCLISGSTVVWQRSWFLHYACEEQPFTRYPCSHPDLLRLPFWPRNDPFLRIFHPCSLIVASSFMMLISEGYDALPTSKSFGSCAGVILTAPVPNSLST